MKLSRAVQWVLGTCLAAAGLFVFFRSVNPHRLASQLSHTSPASIAVCALFSVITIWFRAIRWNIMLPSPPQSHKKQLFPLVTIAFMINNILPARMGEAARVVLLWRRNKYSAAVSIGSLVLERGIDMLALSACFFLPVFFIPGMGRGASSSWYTSVTLHSVAVFLAAAAACGICLMAAYSFFPDAVARMLGRTLVIAPEAMRAKIRRVAGDVASTLHWTSSLRKVLVVIALSVLIVVSYAIPVIVLIRQKDFGILQGLFSQAFAALGAAIPLAPGYVGTLHAMMLEGLVLCGIDRDKAQATTILAHAIPYITVTLLGLYYFFKLNITFKDISEAEKKMEKEDQVAHE